jgi:hypothetical protein
MRGGRGREREKERERERERERSLYMSSPISKVVEKPEKPIALGMGMPLPLGLRSLLLH